MERLENFFLALVIGGCFFAIMAFTIGLFCFWKDTIKYRKFNLVRFFAGTVYTVALALAYIAAFKLFIVPL